jgi:transposase
VVISCWQRGKESLCSFQQEVTMERSPFLPFPEGMVLGQSELTETQLTVEVISIQPGACCPGCGNSSSAVHWKSQRTVQDVPCGGRKVVLRLKVRKFFCRAPSCPRKVFAERLAELVRPWARVSKRLLEELKAMGLAASAEVSERLAPRLGMKGKAPPLVRYLRPIPDPPREEVSVLGIDDFARRKADSYGPILLNLQTRRPLDLLPDRTASAVKPWLASHPDIQVVSRDRASAFADAVSQVLPDATQVADRSHLVQHLREHLQRLLDHNRSGLPLVEDTAVKRSQTSTKEHADAPADRAAEVNAHSTPEVLPAEQHEGHTYAEAVLSCLTSAERKKQISRDQRLSRDAEVMALHREGLGQRALARQLRLSRNTIQRYITSPGFPERAEGSGLRGAGASKLDPYLPYLRAQWDAGMHNASRLFELVKKRGSTGCQSGRRKRLAQWRAALPSRKWRGWPPKPRLFGHKGQRRLSSRSASFLMIVSPEKLTAKQSQQLEHLCEASSDLHTAYLLSQEFVTMLHERRAESLHGWLKLVKERHVAELISFAHGISRDDAAVYAACSRPESNGITEGHVHRLTFLKRHMFGRAHLDLLRIKVLHAV